MHYSLPPLLALPLLIPLPLTCIVSFVDSGAAGPGPGYAFMMLAKVAGTDGGDG